MIVLFSFGLNYLAAHVLAVEGVLAALADLAAKKRMFFSTGLLTRRPG